ncbi:MAG: CHAT domain-containing protein, partial [Anaerolineae bacterium]|nr:CHAT domain-containing protein [Anaerolineae bacterium]
MSTQSDLYDQLVEFLWQQGMYREAFDYAERARARALLDQIGNPQVAIQWQADDPVIKEAEEARRRLIHFQSALASEREKATDEQNLARLSELSSQLEAERSNFETLITRLKITHPEYASLVQGDIVKLENLQKEILDADTTLIEYFVIGEQTLAWVIDRQNVTAVALNISREDLKQQITYLRDVITAKDFDPITAAELYGRIFTPLKPYIKYPNLIIAPHGVLHYLPFAALWDAQDQHSLIQDYTITYAPSASVLKFTLTQHKPGSGHILALGNPDNTLRFAEAEVARVATLYGTSPLSRSQATESRIYSQADQIDILHLAAHGVYDSFHPLNTRIELAADKINDGKLEVYEIFGLNLRNANLVVLSACDTSKGQLTAGDEIVGLTRAFLA